MGLDMYLSARRYTSTHTDPELNTKLKSIADVALPADGSHGGGIEIKRDVAYWRKANQIHAWFVANVQEGTDDCGYYDVSMEQLTDLRDTCAKVLDKAVTVKRGKVTVNQPLAEELLPTAEGFFFGSADYNQYYVDELKDTVEQLDKIIAWTHAEQALTGKQYSSVDFQYHSSW
jgi:hypothetical protein